MSSVALVLGVERTPIPMAPKHPRGPRPWKSSLFRMKRLAVVHKMLASLDFIFSADVCSRYGPT